jgi:methyl-accepting chemotaxis protein
MPMFRNFRVRIQLNLRSQILLLGMSGVAAVGAIYLIGLQVEADSQRAADKFTAFASLTGKVSEGLLQAREIATEFLQKPDDKKVAAHTEIMNAAVGHLANVERLAEALPESDRLRQANSFRATINSYVTRFSNVVSAQKLIGFNENDGLQGKLRTAVHAVEGQLKKYDQSRLAILMLMMRRHEKDFMLRGDEKYGDELRKRVDEFSIELAKADLPAESKSEISKLIGTYKTSFLAFVAGQSTLTDEATDLAQIYERLKPNLIAVRTAADERLSAVKAELARVQRNVFWSICFAVLVVAIAALLFGNWLSTPLVRMAKAMDLLAQGDLEIKMEPVNRRDEVGKISRALSVFRQKLLENRQLTEDQAKARESAAADRRDAMLQVADRFEQEIGKVVQTVSTAAVGIEMAAGHLTKTADTTQELSAVVAAASQQSSASVQSAAAAAEQMVCSVNEISRQVHESQKVASAAVQQAEQTNARIAELSQSAGRISEVVKLISAVAAQTNLLALNATIEAARAGEAGRGFAVVASEVKALAGQTAKATEEIGLQIAQMQSATGHSVSSIQEIGGTINRIFEICAAIAASVEEQGAATQEIARSVQQAAMGATEVSGNISEVTRGAADTGSSAEQVHGAAQELLVESNHLKSEVGNFLASVRAA